MKKLYIALTALAMSLGAQAIELTFLLDGKEITPGSNVEFNAIETVTYDDYKEVKMAPALSLTTDIYSSKIKVTATCTSGQAIQMCAGGSCSGGVSVTKENIRIQTGARLPLEFHYITELDLDETIPVVTTLFEAEDVTKAGSKTEFVLVMGEEGASLSRVELSEGVSVAPGALCYEVASEEPLSIFTADGVCVCSASVSGKGSVELPEGFYIYTLGHDSGKVYIK